jgi:hypothetical protein
MNIVSKNKKRNYMFKKRQARKELLAKLDALENKGMIDLMYHQFERYKRVTHFTMYQTQWASWIRR